MSLGLLWWTLHDVSVNAVVEHLRETRALPFLCAVVLAVFAQVLRVVRWQVNLRPEGRRLGFLPLFYATSIGTLANNVLPARAGEFVRAYAARSLTDAPFFTGLASLAVERVMDGLALVTLCGVALFAVEVSQDATVAGVSLNALTGTAAVVFVAVLAGLLGVLLLRRRLVSIADVMLFRRLPEGMSRRVQGALQRLLEGLEAVGSPARAVAIFAWSLVIWAVNALAVWLGLVAFSISVPWAAALIVQTVISLGIALPSSPGFFGPFEAASRVSLALFGVGASRAVAFALPFHLGVYFMPVVILGLWSLARTDLSLAGLRRARAPARYDQSGSAEAAGRAECSGKSEAADVEEAAHA